MTKWLYVPLDVKVRELQSKTIFAALAASQGYNVVLGRKKEVAKLTDFFPPGTFFGLGAQENFKKNYLKLKKKGFAITALDEEALVTFSDEIYRRLRISQETLNATDIFFAWGQEHFNTVHGHYQEANHSVEISGNMRFDTLHKDLRNVWEPEIENIQNAHGPYILVVSSFGACNHFNGREHYFQSLKDKKIITNSDDENFYRKYFDLKQSVFERFLEDVQILAKTFPKYKFILRPHPAESHAKWEEIAERYSNVDVDTRYNVQPWLLASKAVIHHYCTTSVECMAADVPAIAYRPYKDDKIETEIPYNCSLIAETKDELVAFIHNIIAGEDTGLDTIRAKAFTQYQGRVDNLSGYFSAQKTLDILDGISFESKKANSMALYKFQIRNFLSRIFKREQNDNYVEHKFNDLSKKEILNIINASSYAFPEVRGVSISKLLDSCFLIKARKV